jgi:hypothetical protein
MQSFSLAVMSALGDLTRIDAAVYSGTIDGYAKSRTKGMLVTLQEIV